MAKKAGEEKAGISAEDYETVRKINSNAQQLQKKAADKIKGMIDKMAKGAYSGDIVADFVLFNYHSVFKEHQKPYRDLAERLRGKKGEEVLIVCERKEEYQDYVSIFHHQESESIMASPKHYRIELHLKMGILAGEPKFNVRKGEIVIPAKRHVESRHSYPDMGIESAKFLNLRWELVEGPIREKRDDSLSLMVPGHQVHLSLLDLFPVNKSQVYIGKEVAEYFTLDGSVDDTYCSAVDLLVR